MVGQFQYLPTKMPTQIELQPIRIRIFSPIIKYKFSENLKVEFSGRTIFLFLVSKIDSSNPDDSN